MHLAYWTFSQVIEAQAEIEEASHVVESRWDKATGPKYNRAHT